MRRPIGCARGNSAGRCAGVIAIVATLLAAAPASASGRLSPAARDELSRGTGLTYAPTYAAPTQVTATQARKLTMMLNSSQSMQMLREHAAEPGVAEAVAILLIGAKEWAQVSVPASIERALEGAQLYLARGPGNYRMLFAERGGRLYEMPGDFGRLMSDGRRKLHDSDVGEWVPGLVFVSLAASAYNTLSTRAWDGGPEVGPDYDSMFVGRRELVPAYLLDGLVADTAWTERSGRRVKFDFIQSVRMNVHMQGLSSSVDVLMARGKPPHGGPRPTVIRIQGRCSFVIAGRPLISPDRDGLTLDYHGDPQYVKTEGGRPPHREFRGYDKRLLTGRGVGVG